MIEIIKELEIEVSKPNVFQAVVAKQYDMNTRFLKVTFVDNKEKISITNSDTVSVTINALRPDGQSKGFDGTINDDGTVTVPLHSWMLELVGTVVCDISAIDTKEGSSKKLTTTSFTLFVEQAAWGGEGMTSDPQYDILIQLINDCATARTNADIALEKSAEADAKYDACVEATDRANQIINSSGFLETVQEQNKQSCIKFWVGTSEEYEAQKDTIPWGTYCIFADEVMTTTQNVDLLALANKGKLILSPEQFDMFIVKMPGGNIVYDKVYKNSMEVFEYSHVGQYICNDNCVFYEPCLKIEGIGIPKWDSNKQQYIFDEGYALKFSAYFDADLSIPSDDPLQILGVKYS